MSSFKKGTFQEWRNKVSKLFQEVNYFLNKIDLKFHLVMPKEKIIRFILKICNVKNFQDAIGNFFNTSKCLNKTFERINVEKKVMVTLSPCF